MKQPTKSDLLMLIKHHIDTCDTQEKSLYAQLDGLRKEKTRLVELQADLETEKVE